MENKKDQVVLIDFLTNEISCLSEKLFSEATKLLEMETNILKQKKLIKELKKENDELIKIKSNHQELTTKFIDLDNQNKVLEISKIFFEKENIKLQNEIEDLTSSLFNEANNMVRTASIETYNYKVKNRKLCEEIENKDMIIKNLQDQLKDLKEIFLKAEEENKTNEKLAKFNQIYTESQNINNSISKDEIKTMVKKDTLISNLNHENNKSFLNLQDLYTKNMLGSVFYSPSIGSIRLDPETYSLNFKKFVYSLIKPDFQFDLNNLKSLKFFKKIWNDEVENSFPNIPIIPNTSLINLWNKGKNFWNYIVDGNVTIQPVKKYYDLSFDNVQNNTNENDELFKGIKQPCSFCLESGFDLAEHYRMHYLRLITATTRSFSQNSISTIHSKNLVIDLNENHETVASYPLCFSCLKKIRNISDFISKIKNIHSNIYKIKSISNFDENNNPNGNTALSPHIRKSSNTLTNIDDTSSKNLATKNDNDKNLSKTEYPFQMIDKTEELKLIKLYLILIDIRSKLFWNKIGFWNNSNNSIQLDIDTMSLELFESYISKKNFSNILPTDQNNEMIVNPTTLLNSNISPKNNNLFSNSKQKRNSYFSLSNSKDHLVNSIKKKLDFNGVFFPEISISRSPSLNLKKDLHLKK